MSHNEHSQAYNDMVEATGFRLIPEQIEANRLLKQQKEEEQKEEKSEVDVIFEEDIVDTSEWKVEKRNKEIVPYSEHKILTGMEKAANACGEENVGDELLETLQKVRKIIALKDYIDENNVITVSNVKNAVESALMKQGLDTVAKAYILYRAKKDEENKRDIFKRRINFKPFEYPELIEYMEAIQQSYWVVDEFNFTWDIQSYKTDVTEYERNVLRRAMLAIAQIEVAVKTFWGDIYKKMPKPEIQLVWSTFAESESRHSISYAKLLEILGLDNEFEKIFEIPAMIDRVNYLNDSLKHASSDDIKDYAMTILLFSVFIENISLFSQFFLIMSFNKYKNLFKWISNVIEATSKEECYVVDETEFLTKDWWKYLPDIKIGDKVYQYEDDGTISLTKVNHKTQYHYEWDVIKFHMRKHSCKVTPWHIMKYMSEVPGVKWMEASKFEWTNKRFMPRCWDLKLTNKEEHLSWLEKLFIAIQADWSQSYWFDSDGNKKIRWEKGWYNYSLSVSKERKIKRFTEILDNLKDKGVVYKAIKRDKTRWQEKKLKTSFYIHIPLELYGDYNLKEFEWVMDKKHTYTRCKEFVNELKRWDWFVVSDTSFAYSSINKRNIDIAQCMGILAGYKTTIRGQVKKWYTNPCYKLAFNTIPEKFVRSHSLKKEVEQFSWDVGCITVDSGTIITRRNGEETFIAGNCIHGEFGINIINIIRSEHPEWFGEKEYAKIKKACLEAYDAEMKILDWILEEKELDFVSRDIVNGFIQNRLNNSVQAIGMEKLFDVDKELLNKSKWFDEEMTMTKMGDFFDKRSVNYSKRTTSITEDDLF